mgnify:CR=1 FL=1
MDKKAKSEATPNDAGETDPVVMQKILEALAGLRYGSVEITVHDARVVQVERREKVRFDKPPSGR